MGLRELFGFKKRKTDKAKYTETYSRENEAFLEKCKLEKKKSDEALWLLTASVEQLSEGIAVLDLDGNIKFVNRAFSEMHGYDSKELAGKNLSIFHDGKQMEEVNKANSELNETGEFKGEIWHKRKNGTVFPTLMNNALLRDENGRVIGMIGTAVDLSAFKKSAIRIKDLAKFPAENPNPVMRVTKTGILLYANEASRPVTQKWGSEIGGKIPDSVCKEIKDVFKERSNKWREISIDGRTYYFCFAFVKDSDYVNLYGYDITEQRKTEERLKESEKKHKMLFEESLDGILLADAETKELVYVNPAICRMLGYTEEEITELRVSDIHPAEELNAVFEVFEAQMRRDKRLGEDVPMLRKDGTVFYADINASPVELEGRKMLLGFLRDVTRRRETEEALRESEGKYRLLAENLSDVIWTMGLDLIITYISPSVENLTGLTPEEVRKRGIEKLLTPASFKTAAHILKEGIDYELSGKAPPDHSRTLELEYVRKDGSTFWAEIRASFLRDENGAPIGVLGVSRDISERKKVESAQRLAQLGELVADMAHEVNNPLMIISGRAELSLLEKIQNKEVENNLRIIFDQCDRAKDIIERLLKFSRPSKGKVSEVAINSSLDCIVGLVEHQFSLKDIKIEKKYASALPSMEVDEKQIQEVLMNLLKNAADAMPEGGKITLSTRKKGDFVRIDVADTGKGMTEEGLGKIFNPFYTTKEKGTGLGIPVCYGIVKDHGGELKYSSRPGKGTTATVLLPIAKEGQ